MGVFSKLLGSFQNNIGPADKKPYKEMVNTQQYDFTLNDFEKSVLDELVNQLCIRGISEEVTYSYLSDGTMSVCMSKIGQIGRVKLRGRKYRMQIIKLVNLKNNDISVEWLEDVSYDDILLNIPRWVLYAQKELSYCKRR